MISKHSYVFKWGISYVYSTHHTPPQNSFMIAQRATRMLILLSGFAVCATSQKAECARCRSAVRVRTRGMSKKEKRPRSNRRNNDSKFPRNPRRSRKVAELRKETRDCDSETTSQCDHGRIATAKCGPLTRKRAASKATWRIIKQDGFLESKTNYLPSAGRVGQNCLDSVPPVQ